MDIRINNHGETFLSALTALHSLDSSMDQRREAERWLMSFQGSKECWIACKHLIEDASTPKDVQVCIELAFAISNVNRLLKGLPHRSRNLNLASHGLFYSLLSTQILAAQMMKGSAGLLRSAFASQDECRKMQHDLLSLLVPQQSAPHQRRHHHLAVRQLCMGLALVSLTCADLTLCPLLDHLMSVEMPGVTALLALEYLAEEVLGLSLFGPGKYFSKTGLQIFYACHID